ncbi:hypothetical protein LGM69_13040, partial [Burkholderia multivorans]|nr:hypothetical protein [Burkholderia multivorans]
MAARFGGADRLRRRATVLKFSADAPIFSTYAGRIEGGPKHERSRPIYTRNGRDGDTRRMRTRARGGAVDFAQGNTDQFGLAVIADEAKGVVERSSRNGPTTMQRQIGFAEAESA